MDETLLAQCGEYLEFEEHPIFRQELEKLIELNETESIRDRFYTQLAFGTGGLRGVIGAGYNRMNPYMVKRATLGLARYVNKQGVDNPSAVIAYDSRRYSVEFAESTALVFCQNGIRTYLFSSLRPTPELSFAVRELSATVGVVITASHNPPDYNGYKVYWEDGGQIVPPHDSGILEEVHAVEGKVVGMAKEEAIDSGNLVYVDAEIDGKYLAMVSRYLLRKELFTEKTANFKVVYSPLHGTGAYLMESVLEELGVDYETVPEQREPDGEFPTFSSPNPEEADALKMSLDLGSSLGADIVMATDPDADRLGVAVRNGESFTLLTGNQLGSLLCDYIFLTRREKGSLPAVPVLVKTIVTTELQVRIAESYGAKVYDVLTGFKYIGEKIRQFESTDEEYVFGGEESYGYLVETEVRDKDAVSAAALVVEMAAFNRARGMDLTDHLADIYRRFGYFRELLITKSFDGEEGKTRIKSLMASLRSAPVRPYGGQTWTEKRDYLEGIVYSAEGESIAEIDLPRSNVLQFRLSNAIFSARPSGTEPKIKFYISCWTDPGVPLDDGADYTLKLIEAISADIESLI